MTNYTLLQGSASEATFIGLLAAKEKTVRRLQESNPHLTEQEIKAKLVCYSSGKTCLLKCHSVFR